MAKSTKVTIKARGLPFKAREVNAKDWKAALRAHAQWPNLGAKDWRPVLLKYYPADLIAHGQPMQSKVHAFCARAKNYAKKRAVTDEDIVGEANATPTDLAVADPRDFLSAIVQTQAPIQGNVKNLQRVANEQDEIIKEHRAEILSLKLQLLEANQQNESHNEFIQS